MLCGAAAPLQGAGAALQQRSPGLVFVVSCGIQAHASQEVPGSGSDDGQLVGDQSDDVCCLDDHGAWNQRQGVVAVGVVFVVSNRER